jgi:hypothetical protein
LGPRTQRMAHLLIHRLREQLAAFLPAALCMSYSPRNLLCFPPT